MRRGLALLVICGGVAALFVSAARTPAPRRTVFLVVVSAGTSCKKPPYSLSLEQCSELRKEAKALRLGAPSLPLLPTSP